jgi:hypothetical protein
MMVMGRQQPRRSSQSLGRPLRQGTSKAAGPKKVKAVKDKGAVVSPQSGLEPTISLYWGVSVNAIVNLLVFRLCAPPEQLNHVCALEDGPHPFRSTHGTEYPCLDDSATGVLSGLKLGWMSHHY